MIKILWITNIFVCFSFIKIVTNFYCKHFLFSHVTQTIALFALRCSTVALCKLLQHSLNADDKRLQDIMVKGEEIYSPDDGIRTRSKSAKSKMCKHSVSAIVWMRKL